MAPNPKKPDPKLLGLVVEQREQESVNETDHQKEFQTGFPLPHSQALTTQLTFPKAKPHFNLPSPGRGKHQLPGVLLADDGFGGE
jgi:hypothetical protein